jgi:protein-L-isoaspartate(D-aspartate) O-methyltransferase
MTPRAQTEIRASVDDRDELVERRLELAEGLARDGAIRSTNVLDAFRTVHRHAFLPEELVDAAYHDRALPIGLGQTISQPTVVAIMTEALELTGTERVLEIGTGSGYQAAILSLLCREVFTIERVALLGERARDRLRELGYANVHVAVGDGYGGWPEAAPFDRIVLTAAPREVPQTLLRQLAEGGILVAPVGTTVGFDQQLIRLRKLGDTIVPDTLLDVAFVPMLEGIEDDRA